MYELSCNGNHLKLYMIHKLAISKIFSANIAFTQLLVSNNQITSCLCYVLDRIDGNLCESQHHPERLSNIAICTHDQLSS